MEFFKIFLSMNNKFNQKVLNQLSELSSESPEALRLSNKTYFAIKYNPETFFSNFDVISSDFYNKELVRPLQVTNYKFLNLLQKSESRDLEIANFELVEGENESFEELIFQSPEEIPVLKDILDTDDQHINYFEFKYKNYQSRIKITQTGVISITSGFDESLDKDEILKDIVELLDGRELR